MLRRFLLVGLYVFFPFHQGSIMQLGLANLTQLIYLTIQLQAMPYRSKIDNWIALSCSLLLSVILLCSIFYRYESFLELPDIRAIMSLEQRSDFELATLLLLGILILSIFFALFLSALLTWVQWMQEKARKHREALASKARRLRET